MATGFVVEIASIKLPNNEGTLRFFERTEDSRYKPVKANIEKRSYRSIGLGICHCSGGVDIVDVSELKRVLYCEGCGLREKIPKRGESIGELRHYFEVTLPADQIAAANIMEVLGDQKLP